MTQTKKRPNYALFGSKGGRTTGPTKRRSTEHYRLLSRLGVEARLAKKTALPTKNPLDSSS